MPELTPYQAAVAEVVSSLRPGDVMTYGEIAAEAGFPGAARGVAGVLKKVDGLPWWRVTRANGRLVERLAKEQGERLRGEGVTIANGRVVG